MVTPLAPLRPSIQGLGPSFAADALDMAMDRIARRSGGLAALSLVAAAIVASPGIAALRSAQGSLERPTRASDHAGTAASKGIAFSFTAKPKSPTTARSASFGWKVSGAERVRCALDRGAARVCSHAHYRHLAPGRHTFRVIASRAGTARTIRVSWRIVQRQAAPSARHTAPGEPKPVAPAPVPIPPSQAPPVPVPVPPAPGPPAPVPGQISTPAPTPPPAPAPTPPSKGGTTDFAPPLPPLPPSSYSLPAGAVVVSSSAELSAALQGSTKDIVLADGTYDSPSYFADTNGSRLYAAHVGKAVLHAGLMVGGNWGSGGAIVRGLAFDVSDPSKTFQSSEINTWGPAGANTQVLDCTFEGNWKIGAGLLAMNPSGLVAQRLQFSHFTDEGIRASDNVHVSYGSPTPHISSITDISVDGVSYAQPGSSNGTAESGLFIGHPVTNGVHRIRVRNTAVAGIETVNNAWDTTYTDLDIDMSGPHAAMGVGVYLEHDSFHDTFDGFVITGAQTGFNGEWNYGIAGNGAAQHDVIRNGTIDATGWTHTTGHTVGVYLDEGSDSNTVTGVTFVNQNWAAIGAYRNVGTNTFTGNTYHLAGGATQLSDGHV